MATMNPAAASADDRHEVPLWRLYVLRAVAILAIVTFSINIVPHLFNPDPANRGMITSMLAGFWVLAFFAIRYPLQFLPLFLFEFVWKAIWLFAFGLPRWTAGIRTPQLSQDMVDIGLFSIVAGLIIPWGYVWRHYVKKPSERWR